ncbi:hypothetical protein SAMN05518855_1001703 [Paenibacillus sp. CF384]|nr:hypothetical protein SAMN05518855_1001703 [Paenibacillus sp. CF384]
MEPLSYKPLRPSKAPPLSWVGFCIGLVCIVLYKVGIIPVVGLILNFYAYFNHNKLGAPKIWLPVVGAILCLVFYFAYKLDL